MSSDYFEDLANESLQLYEEALENDEFETEAFLTAAGAYGLLGREYQIQKKEQQFQDIVRNYRRLRMFANNQGSFRRLEDKVEETLEDFFDSIADYQGKESLIDQEFDEDIAEMQLASTGVTIGEFARKNYSEENLREMFTE